MVVIRALARLDVQASDDLSALQQQLLGVTLRAETESERVAAGQSLGRLRAVAIAPALVAALTFT